MNGQLDPAPRSPLRRLWPIIRPRRGRGLLALALSCLSSMCAIGLIAASAWLISRAWQRPPILALSVAVVAVRAFGLGRGVLRYAERLAAHDAALRGLTQLRSRIVGRWAVLAPSGTAGLRRGDATRRVVDDVDAIAEVSLRTLLPGATAVIVGGSAVALVGLLVPMAGIVLLVGLLAAGIGTPWLAARAAGTAATATADARGEFASVVADQIVCCPDVAAANAVERRFAELVAADERVRRLESEAARGLGLAAAVGVLAQGGALVAAVLVAVPAVRSGELAGVDLAVVVLAVLVTFELVSPMPAAALAFARARGSAKRITDLADRPDPVPDPTQPESPATGVLGLSVRNLSVRWPGTRGPAVRDVCFDVAPGGRIAIVGPSGGGKSTIAAALVRFVEYSGTIKLGGREISRMRSDAVRQLVCLSGQSAHVFDNTIAENIRLARPGCSDEEILGALAAVGARDWVNGLPEGIGTPVGEHGAAVSAGQRQRIALARVALADPPVVVFDEPTEHLDAPAADALMAKIVALDPGRTVVVISHQLLGLGGVDQVVVVADGAVIEKGRPSELLAQQSWFRAERDRQLRALRAATDRLLELDSPTLIVKDVTSRPVDHAVPATEGGRA